MLRVDYDEWPEIGYFKLLDKCLDLTIYSVMNIIRKFDMYIDTREALEAMQQQGDTLKSSIAGRCSTP